MSDFTSSRFTDNGQASSLSHGWDALHALSLLLRSFHPLHCLDLRRAQDEVIRSLSVEQVEKLFTARKLAFKKNDADPKGNMVFDFKRSGFAMAFYLYTGGKDIMLDALLPPMPLEAINQWNVSAKFSRACLRREGPQLVAVLEANLDLQGGVTMEAVGRLFDNFETDVKAFAAHGSRGFKEEPLLDMVSDAQLEKILSKLGLKFTKNADKDMTTFDYEMQGRKVKLSSVGGKELFLDAGFPAIPLEKVNRYNLSKKFIRVVNLKTEGTAFTSLQSALDLTGGVTETIVGHFLGSFEVEIDDFANFTKKLKKE